MSRVVRAHTGLSTGAAILETAAEVLAGHDASMAEIALAAGVSRATLYRYYPSRDALLAALAAQALDELAERIHAAGLDHADVPAAVERLARTLLTVGDRYAVLVRERARPDPEEADRRLGRPLRSVFERGIREGTLRPDLAPAVLAQLLAAIVMSALEQDLHRELGIEQTAALVASLFLDGARAASGR